MLLLAVASYSSTPRWASVTFYPTDIQSASHSDFINHCLWWSSSLRNTWFSLRTVAVCSPGWLVQLKFCLLRGLRILYLEGKKYLDREMWVNKEVSAGLVLSSYPISSGSLFLGKRRNEYEEWRDCETHMLVSRFASKYWIRHVLCVIRHTVLECSIHTKAEVRKNGIWIHSVGREE